MLIKIDKNLALINNDESVKALTSNSLITVVGKINKSAAVFLAITGFTNPLFIPLLFTRVSEEGNEFTGRFTPSSEQVLQIKNNPANKYTGKIVINNTTCDGNLNIIFSRCHTINNSKDNNCIVSLVKEVNSIKSDLYNIRKEIPNGFNPEEVDLKKGMVPVATGKGNNYVWDYPLDDVHSYLVRISNVLKELSEQNKALTKKVNELEQQLTQHLYEEYDLV